MCDQRRGAADCPEGFRCVDRLCVAPNAALDMDPRSGCASDGTLLVMARGQRAWACPGSFSAGDFRSLCGSAPGTHVCGQDPHDAELLKLLDCDQLSGFYLAQFDITMTQNGSNYEAQCDAPPGSGARALLGCGAASDVVTLSTADCHALHHAIPCPQSGAWSCSAQSGILDAAHDGAAAQAGSALCCSSAPR